ncbi:MAG: hypothetical protein WCT13_06130 [Patescibacteria group bacterium]
MEKRYKNATFSETLDNLVGEKGLKTDVTVKIAPATIPIVTIIVIVGVTAGILIAGGIQSLFKK